MKQEKVYFAFISYKSEDVEWATWLQHELEHYHLPASFNGRTDVPQELRPVFRDIDELSAGNLPEQIKQALANSQNLIVICSPQAAQSPWVNKEVETFISLGRTDRIFPFIVEGNSPSEFFPPALLNLPKKEERLGGDVSKKGRDAAFVKVVAGMLGVGFDSLWNRYEKEKAEEERKQREQRDNLMKTQARFLSEKIIQLVDDGDAYLARILGLKILPTQDQQDYPYTTEAEFAFRKACSSNFRMFMGHTDSVRSVSIDPSGNILATASFDNYIMLWDINTGKCIDKLGKPSLMEGSFRGDVLDEIIFERDYLGFNSVEFSPDGKILVAAGRDATIYLYNIKTKEYIYSQSNNWIHTPIVYATFSPNMENFISVGGSQENSFWRNNNLERFSSGVVSYKIDDFNEIRTTNCLADSGDTEYIAFSPDGECIASVFNGHMKLWDSKKQKLIHDFSEQTHNPENYNRSVVKFSSDGKLLACAYGNIIEIWDYKNYTKLQIINNKENEIYCFSFMPDCTHIISGGKDSVIYLWDINSGLCVNQLYGHSAPINSLAVLQDGRYIISCSDDYSVRLWDIKEDMSVSSEINHWDDNWGRQNTLESFSTDNMYKAKYIQEHDGIHIVKQEWGGIEYFLVNPYLTPIDYVDFSPNRNNLLVLSDSKDVYVFKNLTLIEEKSAKQNEKNAAANFYQTPVFYPEEIELLILKGHIGVVKWASFSPDGQYIVTCGEDKAVRVWKTENGMCVQVYLGHKDSVYHVNFSADSKSIISTSMDGTIKTWNFQPLKLLVDETENQFCNRTLTPEERKKYYLE